MLVANFIYLCYVFYPYINQIQSVKLQIKMSNQFVRSFDNYQSPTSNRISKKTKAFVNMTNPQLKINQKYSWRNNTNYDINMPQVIQYPARKQPLFKNLLDYQENSIQFRKAQKPYETQQSDFQSNSFINKKAQTTIKSPLYRGQGEAIRLNSIIKNQNQIINSLRYSNQELMFQISQIKQSLEYLSENAVKREAQLLDLVDQYEQLIYEKQETIKNMSRFNDQLCRGFLEKAFRNQGMNLQESRRFLQESKKRLQQQICINTGLISRPSQKEVTENLAKNRSLKYQTSNRSKKQTTNEYKNNSEMSLKRHETSNRQQINHYQVQTQQKNLQSKRRDLQDKNGVGKLKTTRILPLSFDESLPLEQDAIDPNADFNLSGDNLAVNLLNKMEGFHIADLSQIDIKCSFPSFETYEPVKKVDPLQEFQKQKKETISQKNSASSKYKIEKNQSAGSSKNIYPKAISNESNKTAKMAVVKQQSLIHSDAASTPTQQKDISLNQQQKQIITVNTSQERVQNMLQKCYQVYGDEERIKLIQSCEKIEQRQQKFLNPPKSLIQMKGLKLVSTLKSLQQTNKSNLKESQQISQCDQTVKLSERQGKASKMTFKCTQSIENQNLVTRETRNTNLSSKSNQHNSFDDNQHNKGSVTSREVGRFSSVKQTEQSPNNYQMNKRKSQQKIFQSKFSFSAKQFEGESQKVQQNRERGGNKL